MTDFGNVNVSGDERFYNYTYSKDTDDWILDRVATSTVIDSNGDEVKKTLFYYDDLGLNAVGSKGALSKKEDWNNDGNNSYSYFEYDGFGNVVKSTDSVGNSVSYNYDSTYTYPVSVVNALGHLTTYSYDLGTGNLLYEEKNGIRNSFEYDTFGRIVKEIKPLDSSTLPTTEYSYSFDGSAPEIITISLKTTSNKSNTVRYYYDGFANLIQLKADVENDRQIVKNIFYDSLGRVKQEQNPYFSAFNDNLTDVSSADNYTLYIYDALDRVVGVLNPDGTMKNITFDRWNISDTDENGNKHIYEIDAFDRIVKVHELFYDSIIFKNETFVTTYSYDGNDNLVKIVDNEGNEFKFTYDSLSRKTKMDDPDLGVWSYVYDQNGNLVLQSGGGGNLISDENYYREYDAFGQLSTIRNGTTGSSPTLEQYFYEQDGQRIKIKKFDGANTTIYTPFKEFMRITNVSGTFDYTYIYDGDTLIARKNPDGSVQYDHADHLGSVGVITDAAGGVVEQTTYSPYGEELSGGTADVKGYTGQYDDEATGQMYYGARYYKPDVAMFVQGDPLYANRVLYGELKNRINYNPQNLNKYSYVLNNPYKYSDPTGLWTLQIGVSGVSGFGLGGTYGGGLIIGYSNEGGFQYGTYEAYGGGLHIGATGSFTVDIAGSRNNYIEDINGNTLTIGGSGDVGISVPGATLIGATVGGEVNVPLDEDNEVPNNRRIRPSGTINIGVGTGTMFEGHAYLVHTKVTQKGGRSRSSDSQAKALARFWAGKKNEKENKMAVTKK